MRCEVELPTGLQMTCDCSLDFGVCGLQFASVIADLEAELGPGAPARTWKSGRKIPVSTGMAGTPKFRYAAPLHSKLN